MLCVTAQNLQNFKEIIFRGIIIVIILEGHFQMLRQVWNEVQQIC